MSVERPCYSSSQYPLGHNITTTNGSMDATAPSTRYAGVQHKRVEGSLTLTLNELLFRSVGVGAGVGGQVGSQQQTTRIPWKNVLKHQVSPATDPKALLKLVLGNTTKNGSSGSGGRSKLTFQLTNREKLERIRKDVTARLRQWRSRSSSNGNLSSKNGRKKSKSVLIKPAPYRQRHSNDGQKERRQEEIAEESTRRNDRNLLFNIGPDAWTLVKCYLLDLDVMSLIQTCRTAYEMLTTDMLQDMGSLPHIIFQDQKHFSTLHKTEANVYSFLVQTIVSRNSIVRRNIARIKNDSKGWCNDHGQRLQIHIRVDREPLYKVRASQGPGITALREAGCEPHPSYLATFRSQNLYWTTMLVKVYKKTSKARHWVLIENNGENENKPSSPSPLILVAVKKCIAQLDGRLLHHPSEIYLNRLLHIAFRKES